MTESSETYHSRVTHEPSRPGIPVLGVLPLTHNHQNGGAHKRKSRREIPVAVCLMPQRKHFGIGRLNLTLKPLRDQGGLGAEGKGPPTALPDRAGRLQTLF